MITDLRFALRMLRTHRWFSAAVILTLALGIGVNTTVFTVVNAGLFKPVPVPGGAQLVTVVNYRTTRPDNRSGMSYPAFHEYQAQNRVFDNLEATASTVAILSDTDVPPVRYSGLRVTSGLFAMLRMPPVLGRGFMPADDQPGAAPVALIASSVWQTRYGGARDVIGRSVRINGMPTTIVGVMPDGFRFPTNQDVWVPLVPNNDLQQRAKHNLTLFGRLKPDASVETANQDLAVIGGRLASEFPATDKELLPLVRTFHQTYNGGPIRSVFLVMLAAVGFVLLIACANVANMMLSRAIERGRELSVRAAMGASRWQLVRQLLVESLLLSCLGGLLGLGLAVLGVHAFDLSVRDVGKPYWVIFSFDWRVFAYFAAISVASGLLFGLAPALRASRVDLNTALKEGTPGGGGSRNGRLASVLVVLQFALTLVLLAGAGMMVRSFFAMQALNPFVPSEQLFTARLQLPEATGERYADGATRVRLLTNMLPKLQALPGVTHAAAASFLPASGASENDLEIEGQPVPKQPNRGSMVVQTMDYLPTIGVPLLQGRGFEETDGDQGREAAVVTREFAAKYWPGESALGKRFRVVREQTPHPWATVIGICADITQDGNSPDEPPVFFVPHRQEPWGWMALVLKTAGDPTALAGPVRGVVQSLDSDLPLFDAATLASTLGHQRWFLTFFSAVFGTFALIALLMASVGIYAVIAQSTARRTREIGIRMALGANTAAILRLVLSRGLVQLIAGIAVGLAAGLVATRVLVSTRLVTQVSSSDPLVFVTITTLLAVIGVFACWLPAHRAAALHPVTALRNE